MNREQIREIHYVGLRFWCACQNPPLEPRDVEKLLCDLALRGLEAGEPVARVITGEDEKFWAGDRRAEQKRMQAQFNAHFQTCASAPAAAPEAVSVPVPLYIQTVNGKNYQVRFVSRNNIKTRPIDANPSPIRVLLVGELEHPAGVAFSAAPATKWCSYCKTATHDDKECWSTRPAPEVKP